MNQVAIELGRRLVNLFLPNQNGNRPCFGDDPLLQNDPHFKDHLLFHEFFHGDSGIGLGADHQTGWTALVAVLIQQQAQREVMEEPLEVVRTQYLRAPTGRHRSPERR